MYIRHETNGYFLLIIFEINGFVKKGFPVPDFLEMSLFLLANLFELI